MTATQRYKQAVNRSVGAAPATLKRQNGFNWTDWARKQKKNPIQFVARKAPATH